MTAFDHPLLAVVGVAGSFIGGTFLDLDHPKSWISHKLPILAKIVYSIFPHRGLFHSLIPSALMFVAGYLLFNKVTLSVYLLNEVVHLVGMFLWGLGVGCVSHLVLDALTKGGIRPFAPLSDAKLVLTPFKTGGTWEQIAFSLLIMADILLVVYL